MHRICRYSLILLRMILAVIVISVYLQALLFFLNPLTASVGVNFDHRSITMQQRGWWTEILYDEGYRVLGSDERFMSNARLPDGYIALKHKVDFRVFVGWEGDIVDHFDPRSLSTYVVTRRELMVLKPIVLTAAFVASIWLVAGVRLNIFRRFLAVRQTATPHQRDELAK
jgi:hypothetical protein